MPNKHTRSRQQALEFDQRVAAIGNAWGQREPGAYEVLKLLPPTKSSMPTKRVSAWGCGPHIWEQYPIEDKYS